MGIENIIIIALALLSIIWAIRLFNRLIKLRTLNEEGWSGILSTLKRRGDLLPSLLEVAERYMSNESETLTKIAQARAMNQTARSVTEMACAEMSMMEALTGFKITVENYPELKADKNMLSIKDALAGLEERIEIVRHYYNATARDYNMEMSRFPANLIVGLMGFKRAALFEAYENSLEVQTSSR